MNESILTFRCYRKKYNFRKLKKYIIIMIIFISIIIPTKVFADTENEIMNNTQEYKQLYKRSRQIYRRLSWRCKFRGYAKSSNTRKSR